jgi:hypothetical protein
VLGHRFGHGILRWHPDQHVHMILPHMPFAKLAPALTGQLVKHRPQALPHRAIAFLLTAFGHTYDVIFAVPFRMTYSSHALT